MLKRFLLLNCFVLALLVAIPHNSQIAAQSKKPSQALRQVVEQRRKLLEMREREAGEAGAQQPGMASLDDQDEVNEAVKKFAAERAAAFKIGEWKDDELSALARLYLAAEQYARAAEAFRAFLSSGVRSPTVEAARIGLARALIETEQFEEVEKLLENIELGFVIEGPAIMVARAGLYMDLAIVMRDRNQHEKAAELARKGYMLADSVSLSRRVPPPLQETVDRDRIILAAIAIASYERVGRKKEAGVLNDLVQKFDSDRQPELRSFYDSELANARLIGTPAPDLVVSRWLEGEQKNLSDLRGKVVLLDFWAMWCGPCVTAFPHLLGFQSKYAGKGFEVVGVTRFYGRSDAEESLSRDQELKSLQSYKAKHKLTYSLAVGKMDDVTNEERYAVIGLPTVILIDRRGNVRHVKRSAGEYRKLERLLEKLIGEK